MFFTNYSGMTVINHNIDTDIITFIRNICVTECECEWKRKLCLY